MNKDENVPESEFSDSFVEGMYHRMAVSFFKYGAVANAYPHRVNALESLQLRLKKYEETGNTEFLIDAANFAMIEFMHPAHKEAHYKSTDSDESPGRVGRISLGKSNVTHSKNQDVFIDPEFRRKP